MPRRVACPGRRSRVLHAARLSTTSSREPHSVGLQIVYVSYAQDLAEKLSRNCRQIVASGW
jgi:hypothetical protein